MYQFYQIMICLIKFDFFCFVGVTMQVSRLINPPPTSLTRNIQLLILVLQTNSAEFGLTVAAIPVVLVLLVGASLAVQREIKWCVWRITLRNILCL
jgi:hypothetical protein